MLYFFESYLKTRYIREFQYTFYNLIYRRKNLLSEKKIQYTVTCPLCKKEIFFEVEKEKAQNKLIGGLASFSLSAHGSPPHVLTIYLDKEGKIRGTYVSQQVEGFTSTETSSQQLELQFNHIVDAGSELSPKDGKAVGLEVISFDILIDKKTRKKYLKDIFSPDVFDLLLKNHRLETEPISVIDFYEFFKNQDNGKPFIVLTMASNLSEIYNNALKARKHLENENPSFAQRITIMDSNTVGPLLKQMAKTALQMDKNGRNMQEIKLYLDWLSNNNQSYMLVDTLEYLARSKRVGRLAAFFGDLFGIKPILVGNIEGDGELKPYKSVRSREKGLKEIIKLVEEKFSGKKVEGIIFHVLCEEDARAFKELLVNELKIDEDNFRIEPLGSLIGIHLGIGTIGLSVYPEL
ncbi:MAG: DegV family EDD domain-containing protein [Candidatus Heimdallarchaeota archaeon]|nr:DegV family EDD domain-containing protein [Candidatus Heimdallarchaeota archaeon]